MNTLAHDSFSRAAPHYRRFAHVQTAMAEWLAEWVPESGNGAALEIGAGTGLLTQRLLSWSGRYVATDLSPEMCEEGQRLLPGIEWSVMAAECPQVGPWDWIFSASMLQWLDDPVAVLDSWRQVLRPGGKILAGFFVDGSLPELRQLTHGWAPLTWHTPRFWEDAVVRAGLRLTRSECVERVFWHDSAVEMLRSLHGVGASPVRRYSPGELRNIIKQYEAKFRAGRQVKSTWMFHRFEATALDV